MPLRTTSKFPTDGVLTTALAGVVRDWFEAGDVVNITVNRVRSEVESQFQLPAGYLKNNEKWNKKSKVVIYDEFEAQQARVEENEVEDKEANTQSLVISSKRSQKVLKASAPASSSKPNRRKRKRPEPESVKDESTEESAKKDSSTSETSIVTESKDDADEDESRHSSEDETKARNQSRKRTSKPQARKETSEKKNAKVEDRLGDDASKNENQEDRANEDEPNAANGVKAEDTKASLSESELSVLIDEEPPPKKERRKASSDSKSKKTTKPKAAKAQDGSSLDPQEAEIKRLQSQLLKCGIRKLWHKELARFDTPRAKVNHLRDMLKSIGMVGRFSIEKARQIKEERELQAEVQAVQDSAKRWGETQTDEDEDEGGGGKRPHRRMAKGLEDLEFLGDDDGAETD